MKFKFFLSLTLGAFLVTLIACSDESDASLLDSPDQVSERSSINLSISYEMTTQQIIEPTKGTVKDLCPIDIKMISLPNSTSIVNATFGPNGNPCIEMRQPARPGNGEGDKGSKATKTTFCNGVITNTGPDGTSTSIETDFDLQFFNSLAQSYYYTDKQKDDAMAAMIKAAKNNGATTSIKGDKLTIIEEDDEGNVTTTIYDMKNHVMVGSQTLGPSGKLINKTTLHYKCNPDGSIVPDFIMSYNLNDNLICSDPVFLIEQTIFNNYQIKL